MASIVHQLCRSRYCEKTFMRSSKKPALGKRTADLL